MRKTALFATFLSLLFLCTNLVAQDTHIGLWTGEDKGDVGFINFDTAGYAFFVVDEDTLGGRSFDMGGQLGYMKYTVDYSKTPHWIDFIMYTLDYDMEVGRILGIFEYDETGRMMLCLDFDSPARPGSFEEEGTIVLSRVDIPVKRE